MEKYRDDKTTGNKKPREADVKPSEEVRDAHAAGDGALERTDGETNAGEKKTGKKEDTPY